MIEKEFVPYDRALRLKELGFDEPCFGMYNRDKKLFIISPANQNSFEFLCTPTFSQAFRWFREKYPQINPAYNLLFILDRTSREENPMTYEECELSCLDKLIDIVIKTS